MLLQQGDEFLFETALCMVFFLVLDIFADGVDVGCTHTERREACCHANSFRSGNVWPNQCEVLPLISCMPVESGIVPGSESSR